jgi:hypothetical protein
VVPVRRLGFDARQILHAFVAMIRWQHQQRRTTCPNTVISALFEDELPTPQQHETDATGGLVA